MRQEQVMDFQVASTDEDLHITGLADDPEVGGGE